jgi:hypothetical protein
MAATDDTSATFARRAEQALQTIDTDRMALRELLVAIGYTPEVALLDAFERDFAAYRELENHIRDLALANTNIKAQRLLFGPLDEAASRTASAARDLADAVPAASRWQARAHAAEAAAALKTVEVIDGRHIAEQSDETMTRMEAAITSAQGDARRALADLEALVPAASRRRAADVRASLDRFDELNAQLVALSRTNSNVKSLALSLDQKGRLAAACENDLRALERAIAARAFSATR